MKKEQFENNPILKFSFKFSLLTIEYCEQLDAEKKFVVSKQLLRSATSIGANVMESQNSESKIDFIHKMKIAAKEADETYYWLLLCAYSKHYPDCENLIIKLESISKMLSAIISSSKKNITNQKH
jgi:four helix bundle protein